MDKSEPDRDDMSTNLSFIAGRSFITGENPQKPFEILRPAALETPVIFASPHSGRIYPNDLLRASKLSRETLRQSEDCYVDLLFANVPRYGAPLLKALFPRAYVDVNRKADELDPRMFTNDGKGGSMRHADSQSSRVLAGLGVVPRIVADGKNIYAKRLPADDARNRLAACYQPYHTALRQLVDQARAAFGVAIIIDCHSMPSIGGAPLRAGEPPIDFVLGDRFGVSSAPGLPILMESFLARKGFNVVRNAPYAGGYVATAYGRPARGVHVLQLEINRALYLDEERFTRTDNFDPLRQTLEELVSTLTQIDPKALEPARAAE